MKDNKLKVLFFIKRAAYGGGKSSVIAANEITARGHEVTYACESGPLVEMLDEKIRLEYIPKRLDGIKNVIDGFLYSITSTGRLIRRVKEGNYDLIDCFDYWSYISGVLTQVVTGIPLVYHQLAGEFIYPPSFFKGKVVTICKESKDILSKKGYASSDNIVVVNYVDLDLFNSSKRGEGLIGTLGLSRESMKVVMPCRLQEDKKRSINHFIEAASMIAKRNPDCELILAGDGPLLPDVRKKAEEFNNKLGRRALITPGRIEDVSTLLNIAHVVVGKGRSVLEGMASGKPVVVLGEKGFAGSVSEKNVEILGYNNFSGRNLKEKVNVEKLADEIEKLLADETLRKKMGVYNKKIITENYDVKKNIEILEKTYYETKREKPTLSDRGKALISITLSAPKTLIKYTINRYIPTCDTIRKCQ